MFGVFFVCVVLVLGVVVVFLGVDGGDGVVVVFVGVFVFVFFGGFVDCCFGVGSEVVVGGG